MSKIKEFIKAFERSDEEIAPFCILVITFCNLVESPFILKQISARLVLEQENK